MSDFCFIEGLIDPNQCIGNSLSTINYNFSVLDSNLCLLSAVTSPSAFNPAYLEDADADLSEYVGAIHWLTNQEAMPMFSTLGPIVHLTDNTNLTQSLQTLDFNKNRKLAIKSGSTTVVSNPSSISFAASSFDILDTGHSSVSITPKPFQSMVLRDSINVSSPPSNAQLYVWSGTSTGTQTATIDLTTLDGYNSKYNFVYVFYFVSIMSDDGANNGGLTVNLGGVPMGSTVQTQAGDFNSDSGYVFVKIPPTKNISISRTSSAFTATGRQFKNPVFQVRVLLYGWSS